MIVPFKVKCNGEEHDGAIRLVDAVAIERRFKASIPAQGEAWPMEWFTFGAWNALKRANKAGDDFDAWLETLDEINLGTEEEAPKDEQPGPSLSSVGS